MTATTLTHNDIKERFLADTKIHPALYDLVEKAEAKLEEGSKRRKEIARYNQNKILSAMRRHRLSDMHFGWNTGYGYDDPGRMITEKIFADVFGTEAALVRTQIVNGTHALSLALSGVLRPGDELIYATGGPYDTLEETIGIRGEGKGSLKDFSVQYKQIELKEDGTIDIDGLLAALTDKTRLIGLQRATGYAWRKAITIPEIKACIDAVRAVRPDILFFVDNCYGEFLDIIEPTEVGADLMAGSLIKNPGGGLALSGGYIVGKESLIEQVAARLYAPGIGGECGLTFGQTRSILQGLFIAPHVVAGALEGAELLGQVGTELGFPVCPAVGEERSDIIQAIELGSEEAMVSFCKGVQSASPVDAFVDPEPWAMPGYDDPVIMAAGAFVQGSSIELSADGPIRAPYIVYFQGGLTYDHSRFGVLKAFQRMIDDGLLTLPVK